MLSMGNINYITIHKESKALLAMETGGPRLCSKRKKGTVDSGNFEDNGYFQNCFDFVLGLWLRVFSAGVCW